MSTYYRLVCDKHKEHCRAARKGLLSSGHLIDSEHTLPPFLVAHCGCPLRSVSEHDDGYDELSDDSEWRVENIDEMVAKRRS